jgi:hypothetical protein
MSVDEAYTEGAKSRLSIHICIHEYKILILPIILDIALCFCSS